MLWSFGYMDPPFVSVRENGLYSVQQECPRILFDFRSDACFRYCVTVVAVAGLAVDQICREFRRGIYF